MAKTEKIDSKDQKTEKVTKKTEENAKYMRKIFLIKIFILSPLYIAV